MTYASLDLTFTNKAHKTTLSHCKHYGSLMVQRALFPESYPNSSNYPQTAEQVFTNGHQPCHLMILNPSAGIALGDELVINAQLHANTHAVLTTTGAGKWYGKGKSHIGDIVDSRFVNRNDANPTAKQTSDQLQASNCQEINCQEINCQESNHDAIGIQNVHVRLDDNCRAEWIPQENIIFDDANIKAITEFTLAPTASLLTWDILVLGRQAYEERFDNGNYANEFVIKRQQPNGAADKPIVFESVNQLAKSRWFTSPLAANGKHVIGTFWAIPTASQTAYLADTIDALRQHIDTQYLPVVCTATKQGICIRYLGDDVRTCFTAFSQLRHVIRKLWWGLDACEPRIWHT